MFKNNPNESLAKFVLDIEKYKKARAKWGWTNDTQFVGFEKFLEQDEENFQYGYGCSGIFESKPQKKVFIEENGDWREATIGDKFCIPASDNVPKGNSFQVGCKVQDHNGALAEGWEVNHKWDHSFDKSKAMPDKLKNGDIDDKDFGKWAHFSRCLIAVLKIIEGTAYRTEVKKTFDPRLSTFVADIKHGPVEDNGTPEGEVATGSKILAGADIGGSIQHKLYIESLWQIVSPETTMEEMGYHGAGSRYFDKTNLAEKCLVYLPKEEPKAFDIKPEFDVDMNLIGWYQTKDMSGGQNTWLKRTSSGYIDDRKVQKYYDSGKDWLFAFRPKYL